MEQNKQAARNQRILNRAFYRVFTGAASPDDAKSVRDYLRTNYQGGVRKDKEGRVDRNATLAAAASLAVIQDIERRILDAQVD